MVLIPGRSLYIPFIALPVSVCFALLAAPLVYGCRPNRPHGAPAKQVLTTRRDSRSDDPAISLSSEYKRANFLYSRKDYSGASSIIESLLGDSRLSDSNRRFLLRQRDICERAIGPAIRATGIPRNIGLGSSDAGGADCGPRALSIVLRRMGKQAKLETLRRQAGTNRFGTTMAGLSKAATGEGLAADAVQMDLAALRRMVGMGVAWVDGDHYVAVLAIDGDTALIHDPNRNEEESTATEQLLRRSGGIMLVLRER